MKIYIGKILRKSQNKKSKGIALVEVIAALGIAVVVLTAMVSLTLFTVRASLNSKLLLEGSKAVTEESELLRVYRDTNASSWSTFIATMQSCDEGVNCCMGSSGTSVLTNQICYRNQGTIEEIRMYFTVTNQSGGALTSSDTSVKVSVTASWVVGGATKNTHLYTDLTNWR
jgi:hypothetical protein